MEKMFRLAKKCFQISCAIFIVGILNKTIFPGNPETNKIIRKEPFPVVVNLGSQNPQVVKPSAENRTNPEAKVLVVHRVPKTASSTFVTLLQKLGTKHGFRVSAGGLRPSATEKQELQMVNSMLEKSRGAPLAISNHLFSLNWTRHRPLLQVNLVNVVREPVSKFVSMFHFIRAEFKWKGPWVKKMPDSSWFNKSLEACVMENDQECQVGGHFHSPLLGFNGLRVDQQLTYFCGQHEQCNNGSNRWALHQAMRGVEFQNSVVGVMEDYSKSLAVMEAYLPGWFGGVTQIYESMSDSAQFKNSNPHPDHSEKVDRKLRENLQLDIEFYEFVKQRLALQKKKLGIPE